jgi:predicted nucleic acid-binding protein
MPAPPFLDTNILIYAFASQDGRKQRAEELLIRGGTIGVQSINEFVGVARGKMKHPWPEVRGWVSSILVLCPLPVTLSMHVHTLGLNISESLGYRIYDALLLAAAIEANCTVFFSEDMQHGQQIGAMTILNPFA